jgi:hypothetical protein
MYSVLQNGTLSAAAVQSLFMGLVLNANSPTQLSNASDTTNLTTALAVTQALADELYDAIGDSYINAYYASAVNQCGNEDPVECKGQQYADMANDITTQADSLSESVKQYVGTWHGG